jgi:phosphoribosyl-ATP pyrophosphohydrolase
MSFAQTLQTVIEDRQARPLPGSYVVAEVADLVYHTRVLLTARGLTWADVEAELERRHAGL